MVCQLVSSMNKSFLENIIFSLLLFGGSKLIPVKLSSTDGIDYIQKQKSVKVNTERLGDLDRFLFPNGLLVMPVEELK